MPLALAFSMMGLATGRPPNHMATPLASGRETTWSARATRRRGCSRRWWPVRSPGPASRSRQEALLGVLVHGVPGRALHPVELALHRAFLCGGGLIRVLGILAELGFDLGQEVVEVVRVVLGDQRGFEDGPVGDLLAVGHLVEQLGGAEGFLVERLGHEAPDLAVLDQVEVDAGGVHADGDDLLAGFLLGAGPGGGAAAGGGEGGDEVGVGLDDRGGDGDGLGRLRAFQLDRQDREFRAVLLDALGEDLGDHVLGGVVVVLGDGDGALGDALLLELIAHGLGDGIGILGGVGGDLDGIVGEEALGRPGSAAGRRRCRWPWPSR